MLAGLVAWLRARVVGRGDKKSEAERHESGRVPEVNDALEAARKSARAVLRLDARVEALDGRLDRLGTDVRSLLESSRRYEGEFWAPLMDALDRLAVAREAIDAGQVEGASDGLAAISSRLEELLARAGYTRHGQRGVPVDGRLYRVVGTSSARDSAEGTVARLVRAAVTRGDAVVRSGEVIAVKHSNSDTSIESEGG